RAAAWANKMPRTSAKLKHAFRERLIIAPLLRRDLENCANSLQIIAGCRLLVEPERLLAKFGDLGKTAADDIAAMVDSRYPANRHGEFPAVGELQIDALAMKEWRGMQDANSTARDISRQDVAHLHRLVLAPIGRMDRRNRQRAEGMAAKFAILRTPLRGFGRCRFRAR